MNNIINIIFTILFFAAIGILFDAPLKGAAIGVILIWLANFILLIDEVWNGKRR